MLGILSGAPCSGRPTEYQLPSPITGPILSPRCNRRQRENGPRRCNGDSLRTVLGNNELGRIKSASLRSAPRPIELNKELDNDNVKSEVSLFWDGLEG
jgi:hypothetical protein